MIQSASQKILREEGCTKTRENLDFQSQSHCQLFCLIVANSSTRPGLATICVYKQFSPRGEISTRVEKAS